MIMRNKKTYRFSHGTKWLKEAIEYFKKHDRPPLVFNMIPTLYQGKFKAIE